MNILQDIKEKIRQGESEIIAKMTGKSLRTVHYYLTGERSNPETRELIRKAAIKVIESREKLIKEGV